MLKHLLLPVVALRGLAAEAQAQVALRPSHSTKEEYRACLKEEDAPKAQKTGLNEQSKTHSATLKRIQQR